ncbi:hypothetical protein DFR28_102632 [Arenicella xantha]|uniref:Secreted protein n=1 Tax=Arenicella xantha TaxID=644221 RepID=A0A395JKA9_9GAMM|nr:hypothetical protein DFR28_102632 [Arenicella xantha]
MNRLSFISMLLFTLFTVASTSNAETISGVSVADTVATPDPGPLCLICKPCCKVEVDTETVLLGILEDQ